MNSPQAPGERKRLSGKYVVARKQDLPDGGRLIVDVGGRAIGIVNVDGKLYAFLNRCPHRGGELCKGDIISLVIADEPGAVRLDSTVKFIACPWHGWEYDLETGQSWYEPGNRPGEQRRYPSARSFRAEIEGGGRIAQELASGEAIAQSSGEIIDAKKHRVKGPYKAEMFPVDIEDDYIVVTINRS